MNDTAQDHPSQQQLTDFGLGKLDPEECQAVELHVAECTQCGETLLNLHDDTFINLVRRSDAVEVPEDTRQEAGNANKYGKTVTEATGGNALAAPESEFDLPAALADHPRYRIVELLGRGGMGDVYRAQHIVMDRPVALKVINREFVQNPQAVERFRREVHAAARLSHPNIVTAHDAEQAGDLHFLVMEFVDGTDLSHLVDERGALPVHEACDYIRQAAWGLQHAHEQRMVHRDIKPHNLMVAEDGTLKILDFGLAGFAAESALMEAEAAADGKSDTVPLHLTRMGSVMGTPDYIAPEQAQDAHSADIRADIYSLGCTLYFLLAGEPPHKADSVVEKLQAHAEQEPPAIESVRVDIPDELAEVIKRMMAKDPAERFQTPAEVADALEGFVDRHRTDGGGSDSSDLRTRPAAAENPLPITFALCFVGTLSILAFVLAMSLLMSPGGLALSPASLLSWLKIGGLFSLPVGAAVLILADRSERSRSYNSAVYAAILNLLPLNPGTVVLLPLTVWTLIRLKQPEAKLMYDDRRSVTREESRRRWPLVLTCTMCLVIGLMGIIYVATDTGTLVIESVDDNVEIMIGRPVSDTDEGLKVKIVDRVTGSEVVRLPSGHYRLSLGKGENLNENVDVNSLRLSRDVFTLSRGGKVIVRIEKKPDQDAVKPLGSAGEQPTADSAWIDMLADIDPEQDVTTIAWQRAEQGFVFQRRGERRHSSLIPPVPIDGDYDLRVEVMRTQGQQPAITFPVGSSAATLMLGRTNTQIGGLEMIDGKSAGDKGNPTSFQSPLGNGVVHTIDIQVRLRDGEAYINTFWDGKPLAEWRGSPDRLSVISHWQLPRKSRVGLGAWCASEAGSVTYVSAKLRRLDSEHLASPELREKLTDLIAAARQASTTEEWEQVLKEHAPLLASVTDEFTEGDSEQFGEAEMAKFREGGRMFVELLAGLPDDVNEDLLRAGYLKWKFTELDEPRQKAMREALTTFFSATDKMGFPAGLKDQVPEMLASGDVGFAVLNTSEGQGVAWYFLMPDAPIPIMFPIFGTSQDGGKSFMSRSVYKQLGELEDKPHSTLPKSDDTTVTEAKTAAEKAARVLLEALDRGDYDKVYAETVEAGKKLFSKEEFEAAVKPYRKLMTNVRSRQLKTTSYLTSLPPYADQGQFVVLTYTASHQGGETPEIITMQLDAGGKWRLVNYIAQVTPNQE